MHQLQLSLFPDFDIRMSSFLVMKELLLIRQKLVMERWNNTYISINSTKDDEVNIELSR